MELALKIFQFILSISILVTLHEIGHFLPAKWFKTKVDKFFLFFDPYFSIFAMKKINGKWQYKFLSKNDPTEEEVEIDGKKVLQPIDISTLPDSDWRKHEGVKYGIGWLPFGGYVKIAGMVDESMDTEQLKKPAQPWEFRAKPAWQRLIIMLGGVTVNFFLAWAIYSSLSYFNGETYHDNSKFENGIAVSEPAQLLGFKNGDKILKIDGKPEERLEDSFLDILLSNEITVLRDGKEVDFAPNEDGIAHILGANEAKAYITPRFPAVVDSLAPNMPAIKAGLKKGDKIVGINGQKIGFYDQIGDILKASKGGKVSLEVVRNSQTLTIISDVDKDGKIGFTPNLKLAQSYLDKTEVIKKYTFLQAIPRGFDRSIASLTKQVKQFKLIFHKKIQGYKKVGGPIAIVNNMHVDKSKDGSLSINWEFFWSFTAMFSVWLAFLNLIPIPGLDGGHVLFTLWEIITRKPVPQKILENAQMVGVIFLLGLMALIFGNDIVKLIVQALG
ncbi:regulator of sigma E protease [Epilithonimonas hungarica]|uniref:RIP metalloprotease RseP n=1 Tax=Epilithonimonas hungarica TaxID=454006 RepID=UPI002785563B|nr:RIP metalloprotease RseP [Epilithonimonas hungarica]MDP9958111.1 regulator of sigma E protease [Epilithonimonas hungarica]